MPAERTPSRTPSGLRVLPPFGAQRWITTKAERDAAPWYTVAVELVVSEDSADDAHAVAVEIVQRLHATGEINGAFVTEAAPTDDFDRDLCEASNRPTTVANEQRAIRRAHDELRRERGEA